MMEFWLKQIDVNAREPRSGRIALSFAAQAGDIDTAKLLLTYGALVNVRQYSRPGDWSFMAPLWTSGWSPLSWAVDCGQGDMVELLLEYGANPDDPNSAGRSPLHYAYMRDDRKIARILLEHGADVNFQSFHHLSLICTFQLRQLPSLLEIN
jgi:ankyrin repeat protein